jgi:hypothetical protein
MTRAKTSAAAAKKPKRVLAMAAAYRLFSTLNRQTPPLYLSP